jgi:hypothetical protein
MVSTLARANATMTLLLASIASVSLVVGGIGIMNVMLLSVTERTKEVGLRLSVGARTRDVLFQFLLEAVALSLAGGALGILFGFGSAHAVTELLEWPTRVSANAVGLAFGLAFAVGVVFGYYPRTGPRARPSTPFDSNDPRLGPSLCDPYVIKVIIAIMTKRRRSAWRTRVVRHVAWWWTMLITRGKDGAPRSST